MAVLATPEKGEGKKNPNCNRPKSMSDADGRIGHNLRGQPAPRSDIAPRPVGTFFHLSSTAVILKSPMSTLDADGFPR